MSLLGGSRVLKQNRGTCVMVVYWVWQIAGPLISKFSMRRRDKAPEVYQSTVLRPRFGAKLRRACFEFLPSAE
jgi:hypothetical protein